MKKPSHFTQFIGCLALLLSCTTLAYTVDAKEQNTSLKDERVPSIYLPIEKIETNDSTNYTFVDRKSVKLHPYNHLIRSYVRVINYPPALLQSNEGETTPYRSMVINEYANCDKKEFAKTLIQTYSGYFGEGELQSTNNELKRWEPTTPDSKERQNLTIICALPLNP